jgi:FMN-dependent dehydrogenase
LSLRSRCDQLTVQIDADIAQPCCDFCHVSACSDVQRGGAERAGARDAGRAVLPQMSYGFYASAANDEITLRENRAAYERIKVLPRMLIDVSARDMSTTVLGEPVSMPILIAPMALQCLAHPDGEIGSILVDTSHQSPPSGFRAVIIVTIRYAPAIGCPDPKSQFNGADSSD